MRTAAVLKAGDELEEDAVDAVPETRLVPLHLAGVLLTLVQQQRLHVLNLQPIGRGIYIIALV